MKKLFRKAIALCLCIALLASMTLIGASATDRITDCNGECEHYPAIIVPGLGQSDTWVLDENGEFVYDEEGNHVSSFPAYIQLDKILARALVFSHANLY